MAEPAGSRSIDQNNPMGSASLHVPDSGVVVARSNVPAESAANVACDDHRCPSPSVIRAPTVTRPSRGSPASRTATGTSTGARRGSTTSCGCTVPAAWVVMASASRTGEMERQLTPWATARTNSSAVLR
jgi:hypothetical protein